MFVEKLTTGVVPTSVDEASRSTYQLPCPWGGSTCHVARTDACCRPARSEYQTVDCQSQVTCCHHSTQPVGSSIQSKQKTNDFGYCFLWAKKTYLLTLVNLNSDIFKWSLLNASVFWVSPSHKVNYRALFGLLDSLLISILNIIFDLVGSLIVHSRLKSDAADGVGGQAQICVVCFLLISKRREHIAG